MIEGRPSARGIDLSVAHCVSHSVRDSAALFAISERTATGSPFAPIGVVTAPTRRKLKVGLVMSTGTGHKPDPEVVKAIEGAAKLMASLGHHVEPTDWPMDGAQFGADFTALWSTGAAELAAGVSKAIGRKADASVLEPFSLGMAELVGNLKPGQLEAAVGRLKAASQAYDVWLTRYDVILSPVLGSPPVELGFVSGSVPFEELQVRLMNYVGYTPVQNVAGAPAMSVPLYWTADGLPVGAHFAARIGAEKLLFELAYQLEAAQPWAHRKPPVSA
jgi:amidase